MGTGSSLLTSVETLLRKCSHWPGGLSGIRVTPGACSLYGEPQGHLSKQSWPASFVPQFPHLLCAAPTAAPQNDCSLVWSLPYELSTGTRGPNTLPTARFICACVGHSYLGAAPWPLFPPWQACHPSRSCVQTPSPGLWQGCLGYREHLSTGLWQRGGAWCSPARPCCPWHATPSWPRFMEWSRMKVMAAWLGLQGALPKEPIIQGLCPCGRVWAL